MKNESATKNKNYILRKYQTTWKLYYYVTSYKAKWKAENEKLTGKAMEDGIEYWLKRKPIEGGWMALYQRLYRARISPSGRPRLEWVTRKEQRIHKSGTGNNNGTPQTINPSKIISARFTNLKLNGILTKLR